MHTIPAWLGPAIPTGMQLTAILVVVCFSAGLNVYATVAMLGLLSRGHLLALPPSLHPLESWYAIGVCATLFMVEFVGDKVPVFDLLWNAFQTFVRIPVAALLTYAATAQLPEWQRLVAVFLGSVVALAAHGGKTAARAAVTPAPEPFSNVALSASEDAIVVFLMWFATKHAYAAATIVMVMLAIIALMIRFVIRAMRTLFRDAEETLTGDASSAAASGTRLS
jgi:Domain of unknown function (DUF4126)